MSVFNVHVNRAPVAGRVEAVAYRPGKFLNASLDKASVDNERNAVTIDSENGARIMVVQIAGLIARRIICYVAPEHQVKRGQRFGMICFGSRLEVYMPPGAQLACAVGDKVLAGASIVGRTVNIISCLFLIESIPARADGGTRAGHILSRRNDAETLRHRSGPRRWHRSGSCG